MKRLILDYLRRRAWILVTGAVFEFFMGGAAAVFANDNGHHPLVGMQLPIGLFMGALLLSADLQRGLARVATALPLTARQVGRAWWLATVAIPAAGFSMLLFVGAGSVWLSRPGAQFPSGELAMASVVLSVWLGATFTIFFGTGRGFYGSSWWKRALNVSFSVLWGATIGGSFWVFQNALEHKVTQAVYLAACLALTVWGWLRAGQFVADRASSRPATQSGSGPRDGRQRAPARLPAGYGGIPFFISTTFAPAFRLGLAMLALLPLIALLQGGGKNWRGVVESFSALGFFPLWFILFFALTPAFLQLRLLRSLPLTASRIAVTMMAAILLPLVALGMATAGLIALISGAHAALDLANQFYLLSLPPAALSVVFVTRMGAGVPAYLLMFLAMIGAQTAPLWLEMLFHHNPVSWVPTLAIDGFFVLLSFWLTRRSLTHSYHAYRHPQNLLDPPTWGLGQ